MFKKSRRKIVWSIMATLILLWVGTLVVIYSSSYLEMAKQNEGMLMAHAQRYHLSHEPEGTKLPTPPFLGGDMAFDQSPMFQLSNFYSVALDYDGNVLEIENGPPTIHTDDYLASIAKEILQNHKQSGTKKNLVYYQCEKESYQLVVFKDNTLMHEGAMTLFRYTMIFGILALGIFYFVSLFLAKKIVNPLEESY